MLPTLDARADAGETKTQGSGWQACPRRPHRADESERLHFPVSDMAHVPVGQGEHEVLVLRLSTPSGQILNLPDDMWDSAEFGPPPTGWVGQSQFRAGRAPRETLAWRQLFDRLDVPAPSLNDDRIRYLVNEGFTESDRVDLDVLSTGPSLTCMMRRAAVPDTTIISLSSFGLRPGGLGPLRVGMSGTALMRYGVVNQHDGRWSNKTGDLETTGITFLSNGDDATNALTGIVIDPRRGHPVDRLGYTFSQDAMPHGWRAVKVTPDLAHAFQIEGADWILFSDEGALTLWFTDEPGYAARGYIDRAAATAGTGLGTYRPPAPAQ